MLHLLKRRVHAFRDTVDLVHQVFLVPQTGAPSPIAFHHPDQCGWRAHWYNQAKGSGYGRVPELVLSSAYLHRQGDDNALLVKLLDAAYPMHRGYHLSDRLSAGGKVEVISKVSVYEEAMKGDKAALRALSTALRMCRRPWHP